MKKDNTINILMVCNLENDAVEISNLLRNNGITLRPSIVYSVDSFEKEIMKNSHEVILFLSEIDNLNPSSALIKIKKTKNNGAFIVIGKYNKDEYLSLMEYGSNAVIDEDEEQLICITVKNQFSVIQKMRAYDSLKVQLEDSEKRCQQLINSSRDAIAYVHEGMHILSNDSYYKIFEYESKDDIEVMPIMDLVSSNDATKLKDFLKKFSPNKKKKHNREKNKDDINKLKVNGVKENGEEFSIEMEFLSASMSGEKCIQIIIRNDKISQKANDELQAKLLELNSQDQETGLYNRNYFLSELKKSIKDINDDGNNVSFIFYLSIDKFEDHREKLGVIQSDQIITDIASVIKDSCDQELLLARFEGHKFSIILKSNDSNLAIDLGNRIKTAVSDYIVEINEKSLRVTCSIGILELTQAYNTPQNALTYVQESCKTAESDGGNKIHLHVPSREEMNDTEVVKYWLDETRKALKDERLFLAFQPVVSLQGDGSEGYEVYLRLRNKDGEVIYPQEFLPSTKSSDLSTNLDKWVIAKSIETISHRNNYGFSNQLLIKVNGSSLLDSKLISWIKYNFKRFNVSPKDIVFQLKISDINQMLIPSQEFSQQIFSMGSNLSIDGFEGKEEDFSLLDEVKVNYVKLDKELITDISTDNKVSDKLKLICGKTTEKDIKSIVPYIEEPNDFTAIWVTGANYAQGLFIQEPSESLDFDFSSFA